MTKELSFANPLNLTLGFSGSTHALVTYLSAAAAVHHRKLEYDVPDIGHFHKFLIEKQNDANLVTMLYPWDLVPALDWRSGLPTPVPTVNTVLEKAEHFFKTFSSVSNGRSFYVNAVLPPIFRAFTENQLTKHALTELAAKYHLHVLDEEVFDLSSYLRSGCPIASDQLWLVAERLCKAVLSSDAKKVLITDCDNVLWSGVIAEDRANGVYANPEGLGYGHFIYQAYLKQLIDSGILIAAVTKNHPEDIKLAFSQVEMLLKEDNFVAIMASYKSKSSQITALSKSINLPLHSFVFVDDNPIEIAEINSNLPEVKTLLYPGHEKDLPKVLSTLNLLFSRDSITDEDLLRLKSYQTNLKLVPIMKGDPDGSVNDFIKGLNMALNIREKTRINLERTIQLFNKTNQFNCNGNRVTEQQLLELLEQNGRIFGANLTDDGGSHGEILSILIDGSGHIRNFAMSCRVFQRYIEHVFFDWLINTINPITSISYQPTERNEPFQLFFKRLSDHGRFNITPQLQETMLPQSVLQSTDFLINKREFVSVETDISS